MESFDDADKYFTNADRQVKAIQEATYHFEGTLRQFLQDDKGAVAIVVVGLPPFFHEDNAARGIKIAMRVLENNVKCSTGVTSGTVYSGVVGHEAHRSEYSVVGDVVNLSARLMGKASVGQILVDETTKKRSEKNFAFNHFGQVKVKGKDKEVSIFIPMVKQGSASSPCLCSFCGETQCFCR